MSEQARALFPVYEQPGRAGYIDVSGTLVIDYVFEAALPFSDGLSVVKINGKYGYIDLRGEITIEPQFTVGAPFQDGAAEVTKEEKTGFIDTHGNMLFYSDKYETICGFCEGLALARVAKSGLWGYVDKAGLFAIPPRFPHARDFSERKAVVAIHDPYEAIDRGSGAFGYINQNAEIVIPPEYGYAYDFHEGRAGVCLPHNKCRSDKHFGFIVQNGDMAFDSLFIDALWFAEGLAPVKTKRLFAKARWGHIDHTGDMAIRAAYDHTNPFSEGYSLVEKKGKCGFVDTSGGEIIPVKFDRALSFRNGLASVRTKGRSGKVTRGYINERGRYVWNTCSPGPCP